MAEARKQLDTLLQELADYDQRRQRDPVVGRQADEKMIAVCQFLIDKKVDEATRQQVVKTIKSMNLRPYWSYCREHLLDIGLEF